CVAKKIRSWGRRRTRLRHTRQTLPRRSCSGDAQTLANRTSVCDDDHRRLSRLYQRWSKSRLRVVTWIHAGKGIIYGPTILCVELCAQAAWLRVAIARL